MGNNWEGKITLHMAVAVPKGYAHEHYIILGTPHEQKVTVDSIEVLIFSWFSVMTYIKVIKFVTLYT